MPFGIPFMLISVSGDVNFNSFIFTPVELKIVRISAPANLFVRFIVNLDVAGLGNTEKFSFTSSEIEEIKE